MGGINPNIALSYQAPQFQIQNPIQTIGSIYSLKNLMTEGDLKALQIQQAQQQLEIERRQMAATQALNDALQGKTQTTAATALPAAPVTPALPSVAPTGVAATPQPATAPPVSMSDLMNLPTVDRAAQMGALAGIPALSQTPGAAVQPAPTPDALTNVFPSISPPAPAAAAVPAALPAPTPTAPTQIPSATPAPALPRSTPAGTLAALPSDDVLLKAGGVAALPLIENLHKVRKAQLDAHISELDAGAKEVNDLANLATGAIDNDSLQHNLNIAGQKGYMTWDQVRHYTQLGFDAPATQAFLKSAQNQALGAQKVQEMRLANAEELRKQMEFGPTLSEKTANAMVAQQQGDAMLLANAARQGPASLAAVRASIGQAPNGAQRLAPFGNLTDPDQIMSVGQKPQEYVQSQEAKRHNLSTEEMAGVNAAISAGKLAQTRRVNDVEYGPGQAQYWVQQIYDNPDSANMVPEKLRGQVGQLFTQTYNLPMPKPLTGEALTSENAARKTLDNAAFVRNAIQDPEIQKRIGPVLGRLGEIEQDVGATAGLSPATAQKAQELRTRLRYMLFQEGKAIIGGRIPTGLMSELQKASPSDKMNIDMLKGALSGAEGAAKDTLDSNEQQRFGAGHMRPPEARGMPGAIPAGIKTALSDPKVAPGVHTMSDGNRTIKVMKGTDGTITLVQ